MELNAANTFENQEILFKEGDNIKYMYMVLKGKVAITGKGFAMVLGAGSLLGMCIEGSETYHYTCRAVGEASVYVMAADNQSALLNLFAPGKGYSGIAVYNHSRILSELNKQYKQNLVIANELFNKIKNGYSAYLEAARKSGCKTQLMPDAVKLEAYTVEEQIEDEELMIALEFSKIPYETMKAFYGCSASLAVNAAAKFVNEENRVQAVCEDVSEYITDVMDVLVGNETDSLYRNLLGLAIDMKKAGLDASSVEAMANDCIEILNKCRERFGVNFGKDKPIDAAAILNIKDQFERGEDFRGDTEDATAISSDVAIRVGSLAGAYDQIIRFAKYEAAEDFRGCLETFEQLSDRESGDDEVRKLRKQISEHFYNLYLQVFLASQKTTRMPDAVNLFLNYGFISEKLLSEAQLAELLSVEKGEAEEPCCVYTMREWLKAIYDGDKEPSRNDLGQDFAEYLRELKKNGRLTDKTEAEFLNSGEKKVEYEIKEAVMHGNRIVNGQLSTFVPILYSDMFIGDIRKSFNTADKINAAVRELEQIDYSVFFREALFVDKAQGIEREMQMKCVHPVIIMYPTVGQNSIMWQEITGRKRDTEGRFLVPAFSYVELKDMLTKTFGHFRWDLCKTIQSTNWNNIQIKSLTSEYADYIQFYRKNSDLSEERKEKLKLQIQRGRNNLREIFTLDYINWVKNESAGSLRMNKVAREMLATYCPFTVEIRNSLIRQPLYEEAYARNIRERNKKVHEYELRLRSYEAKGITIPKALTETLEFYRDM